MAFTITSLPFYLKDNKYNFAQNGFIGIVTTASINRQKAMYCDKCNENIGYLCYATYDRLKLSYRCNCGSQSVL